MINKNNNEKKITCKKLEYLYNYVQQSGYDNEDLMKYFCTLDDDSIVEMIDLRMKHQINDKLMPYFIMSYTTERGKLFEKKFGKKNLNNLLAESWFSYFYKDNSFKNALFIVVPVFTSDFISRVALDLPDELLKKNLYLDLLDYAREYIQFIENDSFYSIFNEGRKSKIGAVVAEEVYFSDLVKNSIELFYFSCQVIFDAENKINEFTRVELNDKVKTYLDLVSIENFYANHYISLIDGNPKRNETEGSDDSIANSIQDLVMKFIEKRKINKKDNGAHECHDGSFRKPIQGKHLIISKKNSSNTFSLVFLTLTVFTILGTVALSYADKNESSYYPISDNKINSDLSSIVQQNLHIKTFK